VKTIVMVTGARDGADDGSTWGGVEGNWEEADRQVWAGGRAAARKTLTGP